MTLYFVLTIFLWSIWALVIAVPILIFSVCAWVLYSDKSEQIGVLAGIACPHCGAEFGRDAAKRAVNGRNDPPRTPPDDLRRGYYVAERHVVCDRCASLSFWYPATLRLSATSNVVLGIPESPRPLPDWLKDESQTQALDAGS